MSAISNRYEFVLLFDVENGNPNGDPDAGNAPRTDAETGLGFVTDVCIKRKIRNYVDEVMEGKDGYDILIKTDRALNDKFVEARKQVTEVGGKKDKKDEISSARDYMCKRYFDVRAFGAVMSTGGKGEDVSCGTVRGPVQINFARSMDPVSPQEITITRQAITTKEKFEELSGKSGAMTEMGKKQIVPYAFYRAEGYVSAALAQKETGFSEDDLEVLWSALINMFENDHSAARGKMGVRGLYVFKHDSVYGNAPSVVLFDKIKVAKKEGITSPRDFSDYVVEIDGTDMPSGVTLIEKL
ncbi:MAG: type I-C CRISPR-associated protein Cas7/Csd2 [Bacteroidales bacterium]|nr:type I-C CRISPR-associated protein Cas7/Csd2 [Bacteroidales bacterium]